MSRVLKSGHTAPSPRWGQSRRIQGGGHFKLSSKGKREPTMGTLFPQNASARLRTQEKKQRAAKGFPARHLNPTCRLTMSPSDRSSRLTGALKPFCPSLSQLLPSGSLEATRCPSFCRLSRPLRAASLSVCVCAHL